MGKPLTVLGLQRCGTNFVEQCARSNWVGVAIQNTVGRGQIWKHDYKVDEKVLLQSEKSFIYLTKHPYTWVESIMKSPVDTWKRWPNLKVNGKTRKECVIECKKYKYDILEMGKLWSEHTAYWLRMMEKRKIIHTRYEDFIKSDQVSRELIIQYGKELGFQIKKQSPEIPKKVSQSEKFDETRRQKYLTYKIEHLDWDKINLLNGSLDHDVVRRLNYPAFGSHFSFFFFLSSIGDCLSLIRVSISQVCP